MSTIVERKRDAQYAPSWLSLSIFFSHFRKPFHKRATVCDCNLHNTELNNKTHVYLNAKSENGVQGEHRLCWPVDVLVSIEIHVASVI